MTVSFVIPHWNRWEWLERLLESIAALRLPEQVQVDVVVVDNASTDDSARLALKAGARVVGLEANEGVSRALNAGIAEARGEWIAVLNNDVTLDSDWLVRLLAAAERADAWFCCGKTLMMHDPQRIDGAGDAICRGGVSWRLGHGQTDGNSFEAIRATYFPSATAALFRKSFFERAGGFEERFFAYLEDVDLGLRAVANDLQGVYVPTAVAYHEGSGTAGKWSSLSVESITCHQILLLAKHFSSAMLIRQSRAIVAAQSLWALLAISRGAALGWVRGAWRGLHRFAGMRRKASPIDDGMLLPALRQCEREIVELQRAGGWDRYWRWYFRLAGGAV